MFRRYGIFASGSALGAVIDYAVTMGAVRWAGLGPVVALGLAMAISSAVVYAFHARITFPGSRRGLRPFALFLGLAALVFALRAVILRGLDALGLPLSLALIGAILLVSLINFSLSRAFVFSRGPR